MYLFSLMNLQVRRALGGGGLGLGEPGLGFRERI